MEKLIPIRPFSGMITHTIELKRDLRERRDLNFQDLNPLAWIGAGIGRIFGLVSTYDIEDLKVQSDGVAGSIKSLKKILRAENHRIDQNVDYLHKLKLSTLDILDGILPNMTQFMKHTRGLIYQIGEKQFLNMLHDSCITGYLNIDMISKDELSEIVNEYSALRKVNNFTFVLEEIDDYYEFPLTSCISNNKAVRIFLQIPILFNSEKKEIIQTYKLPFLNDDKVCYINFKEGLYGKSAVTEYYPEYLKLCSYNSVNCLICPRVIEIYSHVSCAGLLFRPSTVKQLKSACGTTCLSSPFQHKYIGGSKWIIKGPGKVNCALNKTIEVDGALPALVDIPCSCSFRGDQFEINPLSECSETKLTLKYVHNYWYLKDDDLLIDSLNHQFPKLSADLKTINVSLVDLDPMIQSIPEGEVHWNGPTSLFYYIGVGIVIFISLLLLLWLFKHFRSTTHLLTAGYIPSVNAYTESDTIDHISNVLIWLLLIIILLMVYKIYMFLKKTFTCHQSSSSNLISNKQTHIDLIISLPDALHSCAIMNLPGNVKYWTLTTKFAFVTIEDVSSSSSSITIDREITALHELATGHPLGTTYIVNQKLLPGTYPVFLAIN